MITLNQAIAEEAKKRTKRHWDKGFKKNGLIATVPPSEWCSRPKKKSEDEVTEIPQPSDAPAVVQPTVAAMAEEEAIKGGKKIRFVFSQPVTAILPIIASSYDEAKEKADKAQYNLSDIYYTDVNDKKWNCPIGNTKDGLLNREFKGLMV